MSFKRVKVVMLPTNEKAPLWLSKGNTLTLWGKENNNDKLGANQHLYFLSDEEIKEGDLRLDEKTGKTWRINNEHTFNHPSGYKMLKIIATTDKSLNLPQPSDSFLEKYVEEYNKGCQITEVMVEYELKVTHHIPWPEELKSEEYELGYPVTEKVLKINPKDNTITIRKIKDSWNREEVIRLLLDFNNDKPGAFDCSGWIEENL